MSWQRRLAELVCAGGALASQAGCLPVGGGGCGNANPDPCVCNRTPADSPQCVAETTCRDNGGAWDFDTARPPTGIWGRCLGYPRDAGPDAAPDAPHPPDAHLAD